MKNINKKLEKKNSLGFLGGCDISSKKYLAHFFCLILIFSGFFLVSREVSASSTYTVQQTDLWDNGYDNVSVPRQSNFARFVFTTDDANITIGGTTSIYVDSPQFSHLGVRVDGVNQPSLIFTANGSQSFTFSLGTAGTTRTVEIISGAQSKPSGTVLGSFIDNITYADTASFSVTTPTTQTNRILVYGDSIASGAKATNPEIEAYIPLLIDTYGHSVMLEGWGYRRLFDDANSLGLRSAFVNRVAGYSPAIIWLAIGTNDYGFDNWSATNFGTAYAATLDDLHTALPSARIYCQTPIVRSDESANSFGDTLGDYRNQISIVCNARSWTTLVDGTTLLTISDLGDVVHPSTAGHAKYALNVNNILPTISASSSDIVQNTTGNTITITGTNTSWTTGTPGTPTFTLTGGTGSSITAQSITSSTSTTLTINAGSTVGTLVITDPNTNITINIIVLADTTPPETPIATPSAGAFNTSQSITLSSVGSDYIKYGTLIVADCSAGISYGGSISIPSSETIYALACDNAGNSTATSFDYVISPIRHTSSGSSVSSRFNNLVAMGNTQVAEQLKQEFPSQITSTPTPVVTLPILPTIIKTLRVKSTGNEVKSLQEYLNNKLNITLIIDGKFGLKTKQAVILFQKANNLTPDGIVGPKTIAKMK